jgi:F-type H+-transporting ATPase subunit a
VFSFYSQAPISNFVAMEILAFAILIVFFLIVRSRLSVDRPGGLQHLVEMARGFVDAQSEEMMGHGDTAQFTPLLVSLGLFILVGNLIGLIPGFESPTASPAVPLGCAIVAFVYYHFHGVKKQGIVHYIAHFFGPQDKSMSVFIRLPLAMLMFPIEIISHSARLLSLTIRLWANMYAGDLVTMAFFSMVPLGLPVIFLLLHVGVSFLQAYIFVLLTTVYLAGAVAEEH